MRDYRALVEALHARGALVIVATDLLALTLLTPPGEWGADVVVGSSQRFGVPMGFGGPHAAFLATRDEFKRNLPGRLVGVTIDANGDPAYRLALQTREQHIRREKATSNICTAQVLLAVIAAMYAVYHGPLGLATIAARVHRLTAILAAGLRQLGFALVNDTFFDTLTVTSAARSAMRSTPQRSITARICVTSTRVTSASRSTRRPPARTLRFYGGSLRRKGPPCPISRRSRRRSTTRIRRRCSRTSAFLTHPTFNRYHSETEMLRYLRRLADKDIALDRSMIPLGSCTMKLNAVAEMIPVTWREFAHVHPFAPPEQTRGYRKMIAELERMLCAATGYAAVSLQPNAGSQGEYAGLLIIRAYHASRGEARRDVCLIPASAHGTNPASAQMAGMSVVVVACDAQGNVDLADLREKAREHARELAAIMVTYPSTHGVFESGIRDICDIVHAHGGQVYVDGANLNALVGLAAPGEFGADVSHLNLHKTFCIPHGGGGPGVGPVAVGAHLATFLPGHRYLPRDEGAKNIGAVAASAVRERRHPADLLDVHRDDGRRRAQGGHRVGDSRGELRRQAPRAALSGALLGSRRARRARMHSRSAPVQGNERYRGRRRRKAADGLRFSCADDELPGCRNADDRAHRERIESRARPLHRCDDRDPRGDPRDRRGPHGPRRQSAQARAAHRGALLGDGWPHRYTREQAAYPLASLRQNKYWPPVGRADNVYGDRNLFCACVPIEEYQ